MKLIAEDYDPYAEKSRLYLKLSKFKKSIKMGKKPKSRQKSNWLPSYLIPPIKPKVDTIVNETLATIPALMKFDKLLKESYQKELDSRRIDLLSREYVPSKSI